MLSEYRYLYSGHSYHRYSFYPKLLRVAGFLCLFALFLPAFLPFCLPVAHAQETEAQVTAPEEKYEFEFRESTSRRRESRDPELDAKKVVF